MSHISDTRHSPIKPCPAGFVPVGEWGNGYVMPQPTTRIDALLNSARRVVADAELTDAGWLIDSDAVQDLDQALDAWAEYLEAGPYEGDNGREGEA